MSFENVQVFRSDLSMGLDALSVVEFGKQRVTGLITERRLSHYAAVFVEKGQGFLTTKNGGTLRVVGPALFWLFPGQQHSYGPDTGSAWLERWALFRGTMVADFVRSRLLDPAQPLHAPVDYSEVSHIFSSLHADMLKRNEGGWASASATLHRLVVQVAFAKDSTPQSRQQSSRIAKRIEEQAFVDIDMDTLAKELRMSPATMRRKCLELLGVSPKQYQLQLRLERAKELLTMTDLSIEDISARVGYSDSFYFSRFFVKNENRTPTDFRKFHRRI
jgi:AraC family transcriptional regulator, arabinose operon regulatory protein